MNKPELTDSELTERLRGACAKLTQIRETAGGDVVEAVLACIAELEAQPITPPQLKASDLGRELNRRFWRKHGDAKVSSRSRALVAKWKAALAERSGRPDGSGTGAAAAGAAGLGASASAGDALPPDIWDLAWAEVMAARCAQDVEAAAWSKFAGGHAGAPPEAKVSGDWSKAYKGKVRFLAHVLRRPESADVRKRALDGCVTGGFLVDRAEEDWLSVERKAEKQKHREEGMRSALAQEIMLDLYDADLTCPHCNKAGASYAVVCDTGSVPIDGSSGHKRQKTKKRIHAQCSTCGERWQHDDGWHV